MPYEEIEKLPKNAIRISEYASKIGTTASYIHLKYNRHINGQKVKGKIYPGEDPGYTIKQFKGINFVIPNKNISK